MRPPEEALDAIAADIERIRSDSRWAFNDAYWPRGANPDRVSGMLPRDLFDRDEPTPAEKSEADLVRELEAKYRDLGIGDATSRAAFWKTARLITYVDFRLVWALKCLGQNLQPPVVALDPMSTLADREQVLTHAAARVGLIRDVWPATAQADFRNARRNLDEPHITPPSARAAANEAFLVLSKALSRGPTQGLATGEKYCGNCGMTPCGERLGDRCPACFQYRWRSRGQERPAKLYLSDNAGALAAAARRRARGEGWGSA